MPHKTKPRVCVAGQFVLLFLSWPSPKTNTRASGNDYTLPVQRLRS